MIDQQRTQGDVFAEITNWFAAAVTTGEDGDRAVLANLWHEMGRLAAADRSPAPPRKGRSPCDAASRLDTTGDTKGAPGGSRGCRCTGRTRAAGARR
jgi:hypothetical protein